MRFPGLKMIIAHMGHPWIAETVVLIRKQPNFFADISALHYRPWQFYNALVCAKEYGVLNKLLFGSDYPYTNPDATIQDLRQVNRIAAGTNFPEFSSEEIEALIHSPTLQLLELDGGRMAGLFASDPDGNAKLHSRRPAVDGPTQARFHYYHLLHSGPRSVSKLHQLLHRESRINWFREERCLRLRQVQHSC